MARLRYNGLTATLGADLLTADTTITFAEPLTSASGAVATIGGGDVLPLAVLDPDKVPIEIVHLTAYMSGATTGTITRAQEGTSAADHPAGRTVWNGLTVADVDSLGGASDLNELTDVDTATTPPANGDRLVYDAAAGLWKPVPAPVGTVETLGDLTDVDTATIAPSSGDVLTFDGTQWEPSTPSGGGSGGSDRPLVDPTGLAWSWVNQGVASLTARDGALFLESPAEAADVWHFRAKSVPAKPYSVIIHQEPAYFDVGYSGVGVGWMESSTGKFALCGHRGSGSVIESSYSLTNYRVTNVYTSVGIVSPWRWVKLTDDATNRRIYLSANGYDWILFHSVATNDQFTPDRLIFGIQSRSAMPVGVTVDSWEEGA